MAKQKRVRRTDTKASKLSKPPDLDESLKSHVDQAQQPGASIAAVNDGSAQPGAGHLGDGRLQTAQRQTLATHIGRVGGNRFLQRVVGSLGQDHQRARESLEGNSGQAAPDSQEDPLTGRVAEDVSSPSPKQETVTAGQHDAAPAHLVMRDGDEPSNLTRLRTLLDDDNESGAIALMGRMSRSPDEIRTVLGSPDFRDLAVSAFNNEEMYRAIRAMRGDLDLSLGWMFEEGTDWEKVRNIIRRTTNGRARVRAGMRDHFVSLCDNEEMAEAVKLLGGSLVWKLQWMLAEGTDAELVYDVIRRAPATDLPGVVANDAVMRGLRSELSSSEYDRVRQMLNQGLLHWEDVEHSATEQHYERDDATSPWEMESFDWTAAYEIQFNRSNELKIKVRMELDGEATTAAQRTRWLQGIRNRWNGHFHIENGRRVNIVFEPSFTASDPHHTVEIHPGNGRADMNNWYANGSGDTAAHEFGHMLGLEDEYRLTTADYTRLVGTAPTGPEPAGGHTAPGLMGAGTGPISGRHLRPIASWLNRHRSPGEPVYRIVAGA